MCKKYEEQKLNVIKEWSRVISRVLVGANYLTPELEPSLNQTLPNILLIVFNELGYKCISLNDLRSVLISVGQNLETPVTADFDGDGSDETTNIAEIVTNGLYIEEALRVQTECTKIHNRAIGKMMAHGLFGILNDDYYKSSCQKHISAAIIDCDLCDSLKTTQLYYSLYIYFRESGILL